MPGTDRWSRAQLLVALKLYCELPFGKMHSRNPEIIRCANLIGRTPSSLAMKLTNFASLDPGITSTGRRGLTGASQADRHIWDEMTADWDRLAPEIELSEQTFTPLEVAGKGNSETEPEPDYTGRVRVVEVRTRIGQSFFRK